MTTDRRPYQPPAEAAPVASTQRPPEDQTGCVVPRCAYRAETGSSYCAMHGVTWGRPILTDEERRRAITNP